MTSFQSNERLFHNIKTIDNRKIFIDLLNSTTPFDFDPLQMVFNVFLYGYQQRHFRSDCKFQQFVIYDLFYVTGLL